MTLKYSENKVDYFEWWWWYRPLHTLLLLLHTHPPLVSYHGQVEVGGGAGGGRQGPGQGVTQ